MGFKNIDSATVVVWWLKSRGRRTRVKDVVVVDGGVIVEAVVILDLIELAVGLRPNHDDILREEQRSEGGRKARHAADAVPTERRENQRGG